MNVLVVIAHPCDDSFVRACADVAVRSLEAAGHTVDVIDLYRENFRAAMTLEERLAYETDDPIRDPQVADSARRLQAAQALVFVYPTWWSGLPAILKGWLERVMVPGVGFRFDPATNKVKPALTHVRRIIGISTYGSPRRIVWLINDNGRRILTRALRMSCGLRARPKWFGLYAMDTASESERLAFLARIERELSGLRVRGAS